MEGPDRELDISCDDDDDCLPGFVCGAAAGSSERLCFKPSSADAGDANGEGQRDTGVADKPDATDATPASADGGSAGAAPSGGDAGAGGSGTSDAGPMQDGGMCASHVVRAARVTPTVMLVVDGSDSMVTDSETQMPAYYPPTQMVTTRWDAVRTALADMTMGVVQPLQGLVKFGLAIFGTGRAGGVFEPPDPNACPLPLGVVMPALNNYASVAGGFPDMPPGTFTPTGPALDAVINMLPGGQLPDPDTAAEPQIIILATDGDPNDCTNPMTNYQPALDAASKAAAKHIKLFVISVGKDTSALHLQQLANLGAGLPIDAAPGATVFYPENVDQLSMTLSALVNEGLDCRVTLDAGIVQGKECTGSVTLSGTALECNGEHGWRLKDAHHIELLGDACAAFKADAAAQLAVSFPCDAITP